MGKKRTAPAGLWAIAVIAMIVAVAALILGIVLAIIKENKPDSSVMIAKRNEIPLPMKIEPVVVVEDEKVEEVKERENVYHRYQHRKEP